MTSRRGAEFQVGSKQGIPVIIRALGVGHISVSVLPVVDFLGVRGLAVYIIRAGRDRRPGFSFLYPEGSGPVPVWQQPGASVPTFSMRMGPGEAMY
jgi:hypothetical protein